MKGTQQDHAFAVVYKPQIWVSTPKLIRISYFGAQFERDFWPMENEWADLPAPVIPANMRVIVYGGEYIFSSRKVRL